MRHVVVMKNGSMSSENESDDNEWELQAADDFMSLNEPCLRIKTESFLNNADLAGNNNTDLILDGYQSGNIVNNTERNKNRSSIENTTHVNGPHYRGHDRMHNSLMHNNHASNSVLGVIDKSLNHRDDTILQKSKTLSDSDDSLIICDTISGQMDSLNGTHSQRRESGDTSIQIAQTQWHCHGEEERRDNSVAAKQLTIVCILCTLFMIGEAIGGALSNSLALFTDVLHLASDLISFIISLLAIYLSHKAATKSMNFGYHRAEVLGALFSVFIIWMVTGVLCYMAVERIRNHKNDIKPDQMLVTASLGVVFNIVMGIVLQVDRCCGQAHSHSKFGHSHAIGHGHSQGSNHGHSHEHNKSSADPRSDYDYEPLLQEQELVSPDINYSEEENHNERVTPKRHKNINVRAAFIHVVGDIIQSIGVLIASIIIKLDPEKYRIADPICTFVFSILVIITTVTVFRDTVRVLLESRPKDIDYDIIKSDLRKIPGVIDVHSLFVWALTVDRNSMAVHVAIDDSSSHQKVLQKAKHMLQEKHEFLHTIIQVERSATSSISCKECIGPIK